MQLLVESHSLAPGSLVQSRDLAFTSFQIWEVPQDHSGQHNLPATHTCVFFNPNMNMSVGVTKDMLTLSQFQVQGQTTDLLWLKKLNRAWQKVSIMEIPSLKRQEQHLPAPHKIPMAEKGLRPRESVSV